MNVKMTGFNHNMEEGVVTSITVAYAVYEGVNGFSATVEIRPEDTKSSLDDLSKADADKIARKKMISWIGTAK